MGLFKDDDGSAYLLTEDVGRPLIWWMDGKLTSVAPEWLEDQPVDQRLYQCDVDCTPLSGAHRGPCHV